MQLNEIIQTISYFDLPFEIRTMIMELVLTPGNIYISLENSRSPTAPKYGVQLLATCRQAYQEGHQLYYSRNSFHIPPCSFPTMQRLILAYQKHLAIMPQLEIDCSVKDLSSLKIHHVNSLVDKARSSAKDSRATRRSLKVLAASEMGKCAKEHWTAQANWLRDVLRGRPMLVCMRNPSNRTAMRDADEFWGLTLGFKSDNDGIKTEEAGKIEIEGLVTRLMMTLSSVGIAGVGKGRD